MDSRIGFWPFKTRSKFTPRKYGVSSRPTNFSSPNAAFDFRFINREMTSAGLPTLTRPIYCTMKGYRALGLGGSASLSAVCSYIKLARSDQLHAAIEDAWLAMQVYLWLHGCPFQRRMPVSLPRIPSNFRHVEVGRQYAPTCDHRGRPGGPMYRALAGASMHLNKASKLP
jgi:DNA polymerase III epsilon subunit-like protein